MKKVLVTGVSGYIGEHCAVQLIKKGYAVKGSVRNLGKTDSVRAVIKAQVDSDEHLEFCQLNLLEDANWAEAMADCDYLLHVASPFVTQEPKDENDLIQPAVQGTLRALKAAKKAGIKRVVLTSSMVAMLEGISGVVDINQQSWTDTDVKHATAYLKSKTLAEKAAWDFIKQQENDAQPLELVVVNPGPVYGPTLSGNLAGESMSMFKKLIAGEMPMLPQASINMSDVRDVAQIHVLALENEQANGQRFIVSTEQAYAFQDIAKILKENGYDKVSTKLAPNFLLKFMAKFNSEMKGMRPFVGNTFSGDVNPTKKVFNWTPIKLEKTVLDTAESVQAAMQK